MNILNNKKKLKIKNEINIIKRKYFILSFSLSFSLPISQIEN